MRDELSSQAKSALARALNMVAGGLHMAAAAAHQGAQALQPPTEHAPAPAAAESHPTRGATVIGDLVHRPAREVISEMDRLSADELRRLREREQAGKQRKTVLEAADAALASRSG